MAFLALTFFKMSAFDSLVVWSWDRIRNLLLLLLLLLLLVGWGVLMTILRLVIVVLVHSVHVVVLTTAHVAIVTLVVVLTATVVLTSSEAAAKTASRGHVVASSTIIVLVTSATTTSHTSIVATATSKVLLLRFSRSLVAILVLNRLLGQDQLLGGEWVSRFSQLLLTVSEMAFFLEKTIFMRYPVPAQLGLVLLVEFLALLLSCIWETLHEHLVGHHILLWVLPLSVVRQTRHLCHWVLEHLIWHLSILLLHLLHSHAHVGHLSGHASHLVCLHLSTCVHIENIKNNLIN
jgi:hypothetical protein